MNTNLNIVPDVWDAQSPMADALSVASEPIQRRLQNRRHKIHAPTQSSHSPLRFYCQRFPLFGVAASRTDDLTAWPDAQNEIRPDK